MIQKTRAVVLHQLKYSETSVIVTLYTEAFGRQSYIINGIRSPKSKQKTGILQPLFLLEIEAYHKAGREIQRLKEIRISHIYTTLPFDIFKSTISIFLSEVLCKVIRNEEPDPPVFSFIYNSLTELDTLKSGTANFHLWFLLQLLGYLGVKPENNYSLTKRWLDLKNGHFTVTKPLHPTSPNPDDSKIISQLLSIEKPGQLYTLALSRQHRLRILEIIIEYYSTHFDNIGKINSISVLNEVFYQE
ncbi:MAG: DNA repair protein RecO [Prolixibacteraceae bacterium]|nr:DNA repair protein RecO [Prolixibacteraceae bacterium]